MSELVYQLEPASNRRMLKWSDSKAGRGFAIEPSLLEGIQSLANTAFVHYRLEPRDGDYTYRACGEGCSGQSTVSIDTLHRKLFYDLNINFILEVPACTVRYCVDVAADQTNIYTKCNSNADCKSPFFGCHCPMKIPCRGTTAKQADDLCSNDDFHTDRLSVGIRGNAVLSQADF